MKVKNIVYIICGFLIGLLLTYLYSDIHFYQIHDIVLGFVGLLIGFSSVLLYKRFSTQENK